MEAKITVEQNGRVYVGYVSCELCGNVVTLGEGWEGVNVEVKETVENN